MSQPPPLPTSPWRWCALAMIVIPALVLASAGYDPLPDWSADPAVMYVPRTALGPAEALLLSGISLAGSAWLTLTFGGAAFIPMFAALAGGVVAILNNRTPEGVAIGAVWSSAIVGALAVREASRDPRLRAALASALLGVVFLLASKGAYQVFIEHPRTLDSFRAGKAQFLAAQGWTEGSSMAKAFERRLVQSEASGWFGLSNVYATVCAGFLASSVAVLVTILRSRDPRLGAKSRALAILAVLASAGGVVLAGGKGGYVAAAVGLTLALGMSLRVPARLWARRGLTSLLAAIIILGALGAVVLRGAVGERIGELSLLFRWFYIEGAARIFAAHPATGVGPAGFKDAYMLAKPALSPEEVISPHSVFFDYLSTLGVAGVAWIWLVARMLVKAGATMASPEEPAAFDIDRRDVARFAGVTAAITMLAAVYIERPITTPETLGLRLLGVILAFALAPIIATLPPRTIAAAAAAGAIAMFAHGQIEVSPVWIGSASILLLTLGLASARNAPPTPAPTRRLVVLAPAILLALVAWRGVAIWNWQQTLNRAAITLGEATELRERLEQAAKGTPLYEGDSVALIARDVATAAGSAAPSSVQDLHRAIAVLTAFRAREAAALLTAADAGLSGARLASPDALRASDRLWMLITSIQKSVPGIEKALQEDPRAQVRSRALKEPAPDATVADLAARATLCRTAGQAFGDRELLERGLDLFRRATELDPHGLTYALEAYRTTQLLQDPARIAHWARICLDRDALTRLDPIRGLSESERREMTAIPR